MGGRIGTHRAWSVGTPPRDAPSGNSRQNKRVCTPARSPPPCENAHASMSEPKIGVHMEPKLRIATAPQHICRKTGPRSADERWSPAWPTSAGRDARNRQRTPPKTLSRLHSKQQSNMHTSWPGHRFGEFPRHDARRPSTTTPTEQCEETNASESCVLGVNQLQKREEVEAFCSEGAVLPAWRRMNNKKPQRQH
jgi:hypothetical protein